MLATGQLRHQIIKDHLLKKDEDLTSLDFKQQYKIKDILNCKVDNFLSPKREQSKHTGLSQNTKTTLRRSCQNAIDVYQKKDWKRSTLNKLTSIKTMDNTLCDKFEASSSSQASHYHRPPFSPQMHRGISFNTNVSVSKPLSPKVARTKLVATGKSVKISTNFNQMVDDVCVQFPDLPQTAQAGQAQQMVPISTLISRKDLYSPKARRTVVHHSF